MLKKHRSSLFAALNDIKNDFSVSAVVIAMIAVTVSYAGPLLIVFQAAKAAHLSPGQLSSWIWAISIGSGITGIILSIWFRAPVIIAWSTPGAVLLVSSLTAYQYSDAIGAYLFSALIVVFFGFSGIFSVVMKRVPHSIITAMLAGILLKFGVEVFVSLRQLPLLAIPMVLCYLLSKRWFPRYAVVSTLIVGLLIAFNLDRLNVGNINVLLATPIWTAPTFSLNALIGLGIPLCIVTMASQNATGMGVLRADGYDIPASPLIATTGLASLISAPFGAHGINLAAITAAICTGKETHSDPRKRYIAGIASGAFYIVIGIFGATVASLFSAFPAELVAIIAGLALFSSLISSLSSAMGNDAKKESALITFLVTISGISIAGVGAAFWGLLAGILADTILSGTIRTIVTSNEAVAVSETES